MISNPIYGKIKFMFQTTNQLYFPYLGFSTFNSTVARLGRAVLLSGHATLCNHSCGPVSQCIFFTPTASRKQHHLITVLPTDQDGRPNPCKSPADTRHSEHRPERAKKRNKAGWWLFLFFFVHPSPKNNEGVIEIRVPQWSIYHLMFDGCIMSYFLLENGFQT